MTMSERSPVSGCWVNITPADRASTSSWTMTATPLSAPGWWPARYAPTCGSRAAAQHCSTLASTSWAPETPRNVWNWPAQLASAESSTVALERTATTSSVPWGSQREA